MLEKILLIVLVIFAIAIIGLLVLILLKPNRGDNKEAINEAKRDLRSDLSNLKSEIDNKLSLVAKEVNDSVNKDLEKFRSYTNERLDILSKTLKDSVNGVENSVKENTRKIEEYLNSIRTTLAESIDKLQQENSKKLDEMRNTVDEKLDKTLNSRLTESFKLVQENLDRVTEGLGEMKSLATGVGDLKKVLSNVKTRGIWGEIQLSQILSEILTKDQYDENIVTKPRGKDPVEFAVRLPGDGNDIVRLPIDSKFPLDLYSNLLDAQDSLDKDKIDAATKELKKRIKDFAKDIKEKYLEPPYTTDFGIMFLPIEGLYAEVAKCGLIEELQNSYRIIVAGPTTMAALLNSLQVGFRTLAIQKRSSEVWNILSAVKAEFETFEGALKKAQDKIKQADSDIENLVGTRTRQIQRKLKGVTTLDLKSSDEVLALEDNE